MFESDWQEYLPGNTLTERIEFLNNLSWNIHWRDEGEQWKAFAGDRLLVATNTKGELDAFILGMTIALSVLPDSVLEEIKKIVSE